MLAPVFSASQLASIAAGNGAMVTIPTAGVQSYRILNQSGANIHVLDDGGNALDVVPAYYDVTDNIGQTATNQLTLEVPASDPVLLVSGFPPAAWGIYIQTLTSQSLTARQSLNVPLSGSTFEVSGTVSLTPGTTVDIGGTPTVDIGPGNTVDIAGQTIDVGAITGNVQVVNPSGQIITELPVTTTYLGSGAVTSNSVIALASAVPAVALRGGVVTFSIGVYYTGNIGVFSSASANLQLISQPSHHIIQIAGTQFNPSLSPGSSTPQTRQQESIVLLPPLDGSWAQGDTSFIPYLSGTPPTGTGLSGIVGCLVSLWV